VAHVTLTDWPATAFAATSASRVAGVCFLALLAAVSVSDVRARRIPNRLVMIIGGLGVLYSVLAIAPGSGIARAMVGFALGFALWIPFYALGMGDVKLFAAASCWLSPSQVLVAALISALAGGILSIAALVLAHGFGLTTLRVAETFRDPLVLRTPLAVPAGRRTLPYGLALAIGLAVTGWSEPLARLWSSFV
jgi:prepilin peptidase CpaA